MNTAQREHADAYSDPLPCKDTLDRMEELFTVRRREMIVIKNKRLQLSVFDEPEAQMSDRCRDIGNQLAQSEMRLAENRREIIEVAGQICAEHAAAEIVTT